MQRLRTYALNFGVFVLVTTCGSVFGALAIFSSLMAQADERRYYRKMKREGTLSGN